MTALQISPRVTLRPGDRIKVTGGETHRGHRIGVRGVFEFRGSYVSRGRGYAHVVRIDNGRRSERYTLFVAGKPYRRAATPHVVFHPYRFCRLKPATGGLR